MGSKSLVLPPRLIPGNRVALLAPAGPLLDRDDLTRAEALCRALGYDPVLGKSAYARHGYMAGTDEERLADLNAIQLRIINRLLGRTGTEYLVPSMAPRPVPDEPPRVRIGGPDCARPGVGPGPGRQPAAGAKRGGDQGLHPAAAKRNAKRSPAVTLNLAVPAPADDKCQLTTDPSSGQGESGAAALGRVVPADALKWIVGASLIVLGGVRLVSHRHPRYGGMRVGFRELTTWSFLMATAHGAPCRSATPTLPTSVWPRRPRLPP